MSLRGRSVVLLVLLAGPLLSTELWARAQLDFLYPYISGHEHWAETKLLLLERAGCPQVLGLGSSLTNRSIARSLTQGRTLPFAGVLQPVETTFSFGIVGARMAQLYAAWRHIRANGCVPPYLFLEITPGLIRTEAGQQASYRPYLDAFTLWHMPDGFAAEAGLARDDLFELATWDRLLVHRVRGELLRALGARVGALPLASRPRELALDGAVLPPVASSLRGERWSRERERRLEGAARGTYDVTASAVHTSVLRQLVAEATAAGSRVVLHTPPVSGIYLEVNARRGGTAALCGLWQTLAPEPGIEWHWAYDSPAFDADDFFDWVHLNQAGGERYVERLFAGVRGGEHPRAALCGETG